MDGMKYLVMLYDAPNVRETMSPELIEQMQTLLAELKESGELVGVEALADPSRTRTVQFPGTVPAVTDGPYAEVREQMGGFVLLDVQNEQRAIDIASRWPPSVVSAVEVRPLMNQGADPQ
jgi:hypothetical protein